MRLRGALLVALLLAACVKIPSEVHATFAPARGDEASNFRVGPRRVRAREAPPSTLDAGAGPDASPPSLDGGAP